MGRNGLGRLWGRGKYRAGLQPGKYNFRSEFRGQDSANTRLTRYRCGDLFVTTIDEMNSLQQHPHIHSTRLLLLLLLLVLLLLLLLLLFRTYSCVVPHPNTNMLWRTIILSENYRLPLLVGLFFLVT